MSESQPPCLTRDEYAVQDGILQYISSNFVSVKDSDKKFYRYHLECVMRLLIDKMKEGDSFFSAIFQRDNPAGSFWDGLKIGEPVEFDKNCVLNLPSCFTKNIQLIPASPSFVVVNVKNGLEDLKKSDKWDMYRKMENWLDREGNIISDKVRFWMKSVIVKALNAFPSHHSQALNAFPSHHSHQSYYQLSYKDSGPAMTVSVEIYPDKKTFDIDLVPAFEFQPTAWPKHVKNYPATIPPTPWHLVPKPLRPDQNKSHEHGQKYPSCIQWRMSFHNQESHVLHDSHHLKAVLKLIKKMRDVQLDQNLLWSYAIKTVFLLEMDVKDKTFWQQGLTISFLEMLHVLNRRLKSGKLPFYWQEEHDLLDKLKPCQKDELSGRVQNICNRINHGLQNHDWFVIARHLLTEEEYIQIKNDIIIEKSTDKVVHRLRK